MRQKIVAFIKKETVLTAAAVLALLSMLVIVPDREYGDYLDYRTLGLLFSLMLVMAGFRELGVFEKLGNFLLSKTDSIKGVSAVLIFLCFFTSMLITNDVALLTFVPLAMIVLEMAQCEEILIPVVVMQTIAANLGSMLLPFGNPQNLYLYGLSGLTIMEFVKLLFPLGAVSFGLLLLHLQFLPKGKIRCKSEEKKEILHKKEKAMLLILTFAFLLCVLAVARVLPWLWVVLLVAVVVFFLKKSLFLKLDYSLLLTFVFFFIFIGNLGRISQFSEILRRIMKDNEVITAVLASQCISNVPAALLLSGFTDNYSELLVGCNIGGLGTLIASMASLISYKQVSEQKPEKKSRYFVYFTVANLLYLGILLAVYYL
ncbi:MAG: anion permease [Lachnospiraceae bacterium]|nr:anion permease [Lachnospiraceae bacterium]